MCSAKTEKEYLDVLLQQFSFQTVSQLKRADLLSVLEVSDVIKEREKLELERTRLALANVSRIEAKINEKLDKILAGKFDSCLLLLLITSRCLANLTAIFTLVSFS